ncbi:MAG: hypothetical protein NUW06_05285 [Candidatus Acetothermia bacterium]|jgi:hypothetical protein|nr:hypothetical protein [Candidatus Acetothermia bacterium]
MARAVVLFSGSLASLIATKLVLDEGVEEVRLLHFRSPFFRDYEPIKELAQSLWRLLFRSQALKREFHELSTFADGAYQLRQSCFNCRRLMLHKGVRYMKRIGADFLVTGEVLGRHNLGLLEMEELPRAVGAEGLILRPLSARLLPPTIPEQMGWVRREHFLALQEGEDGLRPLASELGIRAEGFPAEQRCKLTQPYFGQRLGDLLREPGFTMNSLELLEFPLYYKKPPDVKIVVGKSDEEKRRLQSFFLPEDLRVYVPVQEGPMALVRADWREKSPQDIEGIIELAARITASHAPHHDRVERVQANYRFENKCETFWISVSPLLPQELRKYYLK